MIYLMINIVTTGNSFQHKDKHRVEWISSNKRIENQTDHILVPRQHRTSILDTRALRGAAVVIHTTKKRFDTTILQRPEVMRAFSIEIKKKFQLQKKTTGHTTFVEGMTK